MTSIYQHKKQRLVSVLLITALCLSLATGNAAAVSECTANCCAGNQISGHGHMTDKISGDLDCPCCSASLACSNGKAVSRVSPAAVLNDGKRTAAPVFTVAPARVEVDQDTQRHSTSKSLDPLTKIPLYIANLKLIR